MADYLYTDEKTVMIVESNEVLAVRQAHGTVEVWDGDGMTHYGNLPGTATKLDVENAMRFYNSGRLTGFKEGADEAKQAMRNVIGL